MNGFKFESIFLSNQCPRVDRFVKSREALEWDICKHKAGDIKCNQSFRSKNYINHLDKCFGYEPLRLHTSNRVFTNEEPTWPCVPRKMSCLSAPDNILDIPYVNTNFTEILDWNNDNILVAGIGNRYFKWSSATRKIICNQNTENRIQCCKFDPSGELLVFGTELCNEIHDNKIAKTILTTNCHCQEENTKCSITAIDWSPTGNSFASGCSRGAITSFDKNGFQIRSRKIVKKPIVLVRVSPDARHLAAIARKASSVMLLTWPTLEINMMLTSKCMVTNISWHPWRTALLGVGGVRNNTVAISFWDTPKSKTREASIDVHNSNLDAMVFSDKTGELVFSCSNTTETISTSSLLVMSDPQTVVDQCVDCTNGIDRVRTMALSPDGTKLAIATTTEYLYTWNFLPKDKEENMKKKKHVSRKLYKIPIYLDMAQHGYSLR